MTSYLNGISTERMKLVLKMNEQIDLFSNIIPKFKINKPIRLIETFAGIGSQAKALENLGANFEHWKVIEFDQHAVDSYNAVYGTNFETKDITKVHANELDIRERERDIVIFLRILFHAKTLA